MNIKREIYGKMLGNWIINVGVNCLWCVVVVLYLCYLEIWSYIVCGECCLVSVYRFFFLFFCNFSKIEKDDKLLGEESDISDDDIGLLFIFIYYFFFCLF